MLLFSTFLWCTYPSLSEEDTVPLLNRSVVREQERNPRSNIFPAKRVCCVLCGSRRARKTTCGVCSCVPKKEQKSLLKAIYNSIQKLSIVGGVPKSPGSHISLI